MLSDFIIILISFLLVNTNGEIQETRTKNLADKTFQPIRSKLIFSNNVKEDSIIVYSNYLFVNARRNKTSSIKVKPSIIFLDPNGNSIKDRSKRAVNPSGITDTKEPLKELIGSEFTLPLQRESIQISKYNEKDFVPIMETSDNKNQKYLSAFTTSGIVLPKFAPPTEDLELPSLELPPPFSGSGKMDILHEVETTLRINPETYLQPPVSGSVTFSPEYRLPQLTLFPEIPLHEIPLQGLPPPKEPLPFNPSGQTFQHKRNFEIESGPHSISSTFLDSKVPKVSGPVTFSPEYKLPQLTLSTDMPLHEISLQDLPPPNEPLPSSQTSQQKRNFEIKSDPHSISPITLLDTRSDTSKEDILYPHIRYTDILVDYSKKQFPKNWSIPKFTQKSTTPEQNFLDKTQSSSKNVDIPRSELFPPLVEPSLFTQKQSGMFDSQIVQDTLRIPYNEEFTIQKQGDISDSAMVQNVIAKTQSSSKKFDIPRSELVLPLVEPNLFVQSNMSLRIPYKAIIDDESDEKIDDYDNIPQISSSNEPEIPEEPLLPLPPLPPNPPPPPPIPKPSKVTQPTLPSAPAHPSVPIPSIPAVFPPNLNFKPTVRPTPPPPPPLNTHPPAIFAPVVPTAAQPEVEQSDELIWLSEEGSGHHFQTPITTSENTGNVLQLGPTVYYKNVIKTATEDILYENSYSYLSPDNVPVRISVYRNIPK